MKNIGIYLCTVCLTLLVASCSKDELDTYSGKDSVYFTWPVEGTFINNIRQYPDSLGFTFAFEPQEKTDSIFRLPVSVQGSVSNQERVLNVKVLPESTAKKGVHFDLPERIVVNANTPVDSIPVIFHRIPDMKDNTYTLVLELAESQDFSVEMKGKVIDGLTGETRSFIRFQISVNDILKTPDYWFEPYLGSFTAKKMFLMSDLLRIPADYYNNRISIGETQFHGQFMQRYLNEKKAAGETVYEDDGTEMMMGIYVQ